MAAVDLKELTCVECGCTFHVPRCRGQYPKRCPEHRAAYRPPSRAATPEVRAAREAARRLRDEQRQRRRDQAALKRRLRKVQGERRRVREREQARLQRDVRREIAKRLRAEAVEREKAERAAQRADERRLASYRRGMAKRAAKARREAGRRALDPLWENDRVMVMIDQVIAVAMLAGELQSEDNRVQLRQAVRRLAKAQGTEGTRQAAIELSAIALAFAASIPPLGVREPDPEEALALA